MLVSRSHCCFSVLGDLHEKIYTIIYSGTELHVHVCITATCVMYMQVNCTVNILFFCVEVSDC